MNDPESQPEDFECQTCGSPLADEEHACPNCGTERDSEPVWSAPSISLYGSLLLLVWVGMATALTRQHGLAGAVASMIYALTASCVLEVARKLPQQTRQQVLTVGVIITLVGLFFALTS